jgi:hypothetical protein
MEKNPISAARVCFIYSDKAGLLGMFSMFNLLLKSHRADGSCVLK